MHHRHHGSCKTCVTSVRIFQTQTLLQLIETSAAAGGGGGATSSSGAAAAAGGPMQTVVVDNPAWGKNPQLVLGYKKPATVKVVIERIVGRKKPVGEIGATVCRLVPASQPDTTLQRVKKGRLPDESANSKAMNELDNKFLKSIRGDDLFSLSCKMRMLCCHFLHVVA